MTELNASHFLKKNKSDKCCSCCVSSDGSGSPGKLSVDEIKRFCTRLDRVPCRIKEADVIRVRRLSCLFQYGSDVFVVNTDLIEWAKCLIVALQFSEETCHLEQNFADCYGRDNLSL